MDFFVWATIILGIWAALGPLVGVYYGHVLSKRWQKEHWIAENKKQEYRELLTTLTRTFGSIVNISLAMIAHGPEEQRAHAEMEAQALMTIRDRIFIAGELREMKLGEKWIKAARDFDNTRDYDAFAKSFGEITRLIT